MTPEQVFKKFDDDHQSQYLAAVVESAHEIFRSAGCASDFCLQHCGLSSIVFGGTNRLIWSPLGFQIDSAYCTDKFRQVFTSWKEKRGLS